MPDPSDQSPKLLGQVRQTCQRRQYSYHTENAYVRWIPRFVFFHDTTHPRHLNEDDIQAFLNHLASDRNVSGVHLADAIAKKDPNAKPEWRWQYVFPATTLSGDPRSGAVRRHHRSDSAVQRAVKTAADATAIEKRATCHSLRPERSEDVSRQPSRMRHSFATHLLAGGTACPRLDPGGAPFRCCWGTSSCVRPCSTSTSWSRATRR